MRLSTRLLSGALLLLALAPPGAAEAARAGRQRDPYGAYNKSRTPLMRAAARGDLRAVRSLARRRAAVNARDITGTTALMDAAGRGHAGIVGVLLGAGADANASSAHGVTALMLAAGGGHLRVVRLLLSAGADPNTMAATAHSFTTPLGSAIRFRGPGRMGLVDALIAGGAELNPTRVIPPLYFALERRDVPVLRALVERGADVNSKISGGATPLMIAASSAAPEAVRFLLDAGADPEARDEEGHTALAHAERFDDGSDDDRREITRLLRLAAARKKN